MRLPAGEGRLQLIADLWAHVKEAGARSTAQPFENATSEKIGLAPFHVNRHDADGMERIERNQRADLASTLTDCLDIHQKCATKEDVRDGDEARPFVDCLQQPVAIYSDPIVRWYADDARAEPSRHLCVGVAYRRKIEVRHHHRVAPFREID